MRDVIKVNTVIHNVFAGKIGAVPFVAKVCDVKSVYGIDDGRVIKLYLFSEDGEREVATYERGWERYPKGIYEETMEKLLKFCDKLPPADLWSFPGAKVNN